MKGKKKGKGEEREETKDQKGERAKRQIGYADGLIERVKRIPANS